MGTSRDKVETLGWNAFLRTLRWQQGQHVTILGSSGKGKTVIAMNLLPMRKAVCIWSPKPSDEVVDAWIRERAQKPTPSRPYRLIRRFPPPGKEYRVVLRPKVRSLDTAASTRSETFHRCVSYVMQPKVGRWTIFADDTYYLTEHLKLGNDLTEMWTMGRSHRVTLVAASQRPYLIPLFAYQAPHLFLMRENDQRNLKRLSEISTANVDLIRDYVQRLPLYDALYVNTLTGRMVRTRAPYRPDSKE